MLAGRVNDLPARQPVVVAGDFNDWRQQANRVLKSQAGLEDLYPRPWPPGENLPGASSAPAP